MWISLYVNTILYTQNALVLLWVVEKVADKSIKMSASEEKKRKQQEVQNALREKLADEAVENAGKKFSYAVTLLKQADMVCIHYKYKG